MCTFTRTLSCQLCLAMQAMHASNGLVCPLPRAQHVAIIAGRSCVPRPNSTATCWEHVCAGSIFTGANFVVSKENSPSILSNSIMVFFCWEAKKKYSGLPVCSEGFYWELFAPSKMPPSTKKKKILGAFFPKTCFYKPLPVKCLPVRIFFYWEPFFFYWELFLLLLGAFFHAPEFY